MIQLDFEEEPCHECSCCTIFQKALQKAGNNHSYREVEMSKCECSHKDNIHKKGGGQCWLLNCPCQKYEEAKK